MKKTILFLLATLLFIQVNAQKLPAVQTTSLRAPANIKIDGKATEWSDKFQAYNPATEFAYTMANDDKTLYLILQTNNADVINRIAGGGVTFAIASKNITNNKGISFTYPIKNNNKISYFSTKNRKDNSIEAAEKLMKSNNLQMESLFKWIKVSGIKDLDTLAIYNEQGIEAVGKFGLNKTYTIEFNIPINLISNQINKTNTLSYQILINGGKGPLFLTDKNPTGFMNKVADEMNAVYQSSTDFWGEYTLAK
ncbi:MAG: hypothetical protein EOP47_07385 [Sphingobacteriaceae bacterium]|nr:MAG: hypothetical protein EOP47_07385 [Sphingobacteriaceae bacterium]